MLPAAAPPPPRPSSRAAQPPASRVSPASSGWWRVDAGVTLGMLSLLLLWDASGADLRVAHWFGSAEGFAWRGHWLTAQVLHNGGRWLSFVLLAVVTIHVARPFWFARDMPRATRVWWLLVTLTCLALIPLIKGRSLISCPWDLAQFGGRARYLAHGSMQAWTGAGDGGSGRCFPSGHASGAFSFITGWFALRGGSARPARVWLLAVGVLGIVFGVAQVARGAHHPSHVAWTAWICWAVSVLAWHGMQAWRAAAGRCATQRTRQRTKQRTRQRTRQR